MRKNNSFFNRDKCFIIAEVSANHGHSFDRAAALIEKAKECGADAVKFQTYTADTLTIDSAKKYFMIKHPRWGGQTLHQLYKKAYTPWSWFKKLKKVADDAGITFFSTSFDETSVDFLEELDVPVHKLSSFELVDLPLVEYIAKTKKPLILSTGMAELPEIEEAVKTAKKSGAKDIALLKCVSSYPAKPEQVNLRTIPEMKKLFGTAVGISDHTLGTGVPVAAVSIGAEIIEKHFLLSRRSKTVDSFFSIDPAGFKDMVDNIRVAEKALGTVHFGVSGEEKKSRVFRRSLFVVKDIKKGEILTRVNVRSIRPANGLEPRYMKDVLNKKAKRNLAKGTPLKMDMVE